MSKTKPYLTREALVRASRKRYAVRSADMPGQRFSAHDVREIAVLLDNYGYSPMAAKSLLREGYGYHEIEHRARTGQLTRQLGVPRKRIWTRHRRTR